MHLGQIGMTIEQAREPAIDPAVSELTDRLTHCEASLRYAVVGYGEAILNLERRIADLERPWYRRWAAALQRVWIRLVGG